MKNKFKKSKIIVPALALITATTVASVTGTVAWFTASRTITATASQFQAEAEGGNLTITTSALQGTKTDTDTSKAVVDGKLTHGSYDYSNLYSPTLLDETVTSFNQLGDANNNTNAWLAYTKTDNTKVWYGVAWKWTITYAPVNTSDQVAVIIDQSTSGYDQTSGVAGGFEIAMKTNLEGGTKLVYGNDEHKGHVTGTASTATNGDFSADSGSKYLKKTTSYTKLADKLANSNYTADNGFIAILDSTAKSVEITCVAWYEGTDSVVVTSNLTEEGNPAISATFNFYSRTVQSA